MASNNPYYNHRNDGESSAPAPNFNLDDDERLAAQLQAEEDAKAAATFQQRADGRSPIPDGSNSSHGHSATVSSSQSLPPRPEERGRSTGGRLLGKLLGKAKGVHSSGASSSSPFSRPPPGLHQPVYGYGHQPINPYIQGGAGYYPQHPSQNMGGPYGYGSYGGYGGRGYPPQMMGGHGRRTGGGMGTAGAAALGVGGGLLGGAMLANAMDDNDYGDGYEDGFDAGGGDFDGGDFGGD